MVTCHPRIVGTDVETTTKPAAELPMLRKRNMAVDLIMKYPRVLCRGVEQQRLRGKAHQLEDLGRRRRRTTLVSLSDLAVEARYECLGKGSAPKATCTIPNGRKARRTTRNSSSN